MIIKPSANIAILWGTKNATNNGSTMFGSLLETLTLTPKNGSPIDIEDGDGLTAVQTALEDGFDGKGTAVYDSKKSIPSKGDSIALVGPKGDGNAGTTNYNCTFWSWGLTRNKKKEAMIELNFTHRPLINGSPA